MKTNLIGKFIIGVIFGSSLLLYWFSPQQVTLKPEPITKRKGPLETKIEILKVSKQILKDHLKPGFQTSSRNHSISRSPNSTNGGSDFVGNENEYSICKGDAGLVKVKTLGERYNEKDIRRHPNLPRFIFESEKLSALIPQVFNVRWSGVFQESWVFPNFQLYSASFDARTGNKSIVRIVALKNGYDIGGNMYCQIYYDQEKRPLISPVFMKIQHRYEVPRNGGMRGCLLSCVAPRLNGSTPIAVSLVKEQCMKPHNILKISGSPQLINRNRKEKGVNLTIGVCGKALYFYNVDFSLRIIEWVEMLKLLGVSKIFLYEMYSHPNVAKVLDFYEQEGTVSVVRFYYPPPYVQEGTFIRLWTYNQERSFISSQAMYLNDCILRNKDNFDYLGVFDVDEVPILVKHSSIQHLLADLIKKSGSGTGFSFKWKTHYFSNFTVFNFMNKSYPSYIFSHTRRISFDKYERARQVKSFYDTDKVLWIGCHRPLGSDIKLLKGFNRMKGLLRNVAYMGHFEATMSLDRNSTMKFRGGQTNLEEATSLLKFKDKVLLKLGSVASRLDIKSIQ